MRAKKHHPVAAIEAAVPRPVGFVMLGVTIAAVALLVVAMWLYAV